MRPLRTQFWGFLALLVVLLTACGGGETPAGPEPEAPAPAETESVPESEPEAEPEPVQVTFEGTDLEGNTVTSDIFSQSKVTMVNIWATYCNPCLSEMPGLGELAAEYDAADFQIIGIVSDVAEGGDQTLAESLVQETGAAYPHLLRNDSLYYTFIAGLPGVPVTFFFDSEGYVLDGVVGAKDKEIWRDMVDGFLAEQ